jgi:dethiobiotin synthetase
MPAWFVTGTGTDVGKTFVTSGLVRHLRSMGRAVEALKPIISGFDPAHPDDSDSGRLLQALDHPVGAATLDRISPWRFSAPLSPDMAAAKEGRHLPFDAVVEHSRRAMDAAKDTVLLIEGVGGVMVPMDNQHTVLDWIAALRLPVILVAGSYLGTLSHTLTALEVLRYRDLTVAALVVSESAASTVALHDTVAALTVATLGKFTNPIKVIAFPRQSADSAGHPMFGELAAALL